MPLRSKSTVADHLNQQRSSGQQSQTLTGHCEELQKLRSTAIYFLHNKQHQRSYYNLDVRYPNGTQRRVRSRDLPWNMKQVCVKMLMRIHFQLVLKIFLSFGFFCMTST